MEHGEGTDFFGRAPNRFWRAVKNIMLAVSVIFGMAVIFTILCFEKIGAGIALFFVALVTAIIYLAIDMKYY